MEATSNSRSGESNRASRAKNNSTCMGNMCLQPRSKTQLLNYLEDDEDGREERPFDKAVNEVTLSRIDYGIRQAGDREFAGFWLSKLLQKNYTSSVFTAKRVNWQTTTKAVIQRIHRKPATFAVKIAHINDLVEMSIQREANMLKRISHLHVIKMSCCRLFTTRDDDPRTYAYVFMPLFEMDLFTFISQRGRLHDQPDLLHTLMTQVCGGVNALHDARIVHADLKTENVLVGRADSEMPFFCVADLGSAFDVLNNDYPENGHTLGTSSPEVVTATRNLISPASDVFSLGCLLVDCMFLAPIFLVSKHGPGEHLAKVQRLNLTTPFPRQVRADRTFFNSDGYLYNNSLARLRTVVPWYAQPKYRPLFTDEVLTFIRKCCNPNPILRPPVSAIVNYTFLKTSTAARSNDKLQAASLLTMESSINQKTRSHT
jgi:serine/threonine protein kinase